jgi:hypothetical protein
MRYFWSKIDPENPGKMFAAEVLLVVRKRMRSIVVRRSVA